jgi:hypothetical protein
LAKRDGEEKIRRKIDASSAPVETRMTVRWRVQGADKPRVITGLHRVIEIRLEIFARVLGLDFEIGFLVVLVLKIDLEGIVPFSLDDVRLALGIFDIGAGNGISR